MFFYLCENLAGTWQQWYWLVNQNEEQLVYLSVNHNVNCNFSILCCWAWSILSSWWWPYCSTPSGNDDLSSHFWRHFLLNRQGCAADKHYSSSGVRGGQALFIVRGTRRNSIIHCARRIFLSKALSRQMPALSPGCWDLSIGLQRVHFRDGLKTGQNLTTKISKWTYKNWITASLQIFNLK